jgi:hypothetical protein
VVDAVFPGMATIIVVMAMPVISSVAMPGPVASIAVVVISMAVVDVADITVAVPFVPPIPIVVESTHRIDHHVSDRCAGQDLHGTVTLMISAGAQRDHQTPCKTSCRSKPPDGPCRCPSEVLYVHDDCLLIKLRNQHAPAGLTGA